ncbi:hypothetical protein CO60_0044 [Mycobacterium tuberculosis]|nr:hypothetical protein CO60_0044 [Mycobacterium tuberculosis]BAQ06483.1 hypothetical protein KURONO_2691 [Mycobacterium tuberculosis str. Kurono]
MPPSHQRDSQIGARVLGGGHGDILPWMACSCATWSNFFSR